MSEVQVRKDDSGLIAISASPVPFGPSKQPRFRIYIADKRAFHSPAGPQTSPHDFEWPSQRSGDTLTFEGEFAPLSSLSPGALLTLQIPEVAFNQRFSWPKFELEVGPAPMPEEDRPPISPSDTATSTVGIDSSSNQSTTPIFSSHRKWIAGVAVLLFLSAASLGYGYYNLSDQRLALASIQNDVNEERKNYESLKSALKVDQKALETDRTRFVADKTASAAQSAAQQQKNDRERAQLTADTEQFRKERQNNLNLSNASLSELTTLRDKLASEQNQIASGRAELAAGWEALRVARMNLIAEREEFEKKKAQAAPAPQPTTSTVTVTMPVGTFSQTQPWDSVGPTCDRLAGNPSDPQRNRAFSGTAFREIDVTAAIEACEKAVQASPNVPRYAYQHARAIQRMDRVRAKQMHAALVAVKYPAAYDNLANLTEDVETAVALFRQGAQLNDSDAMYTLADWMIQGKVNETRQGEAFEYLQNATKLEHVAATKTMEALRQRAQRNFDSNVIVSVSYLQRYLRN